MDEIKTGIYFLGVVHANALTAVWYFIITNVYIAITFLCMLYVFNMQNLIAEDEYVRPVRRMSEVEGYQYEEGKLHGLTSDIVMLSLDKERTKLLVTYGVNLLLLVLCLLFESRIQLFALMMMWIVGAFSVWRLEGDRKEMCDKIETHAFAFVFATLTLKFLITQLMGTSSSDLSRALGVALPATTMYSISNYVPMLFMIFRFQRTISASSGKGTPSRRTTATSTRGEARSCAQGTRTSRRRRTIRTIRCEEPAKGKERFSCTNAKKNRDFQTHKKRSFGTKPWLLFLCPAIRQSARETL